MPAGDPFLDDLEGALSAGVCWGARVHPGQRTHEVDALVGLFTDGLPALDRAIQAEAGRRGLHARMGGVFCHGSPKVVFSSTCEIGDLLVVARHEPSAGGLNALLLQAKMADTLPINFSDPQFRLYDSWPEFEWQKSGERREITPHRVHAGAQYAIIDACSEGCPACSVAGAVPGGQPLPLQEELRHFFYGWSGRPITDEATARTGTDWDCVVWDVLRKTIRAVTYSWSRAGHAAVSREYGIETFVHRASLNAASFFAGVIQEDSEYGEFLDVWDTAPDGGDNLREPPRERREDSDDEGGVSLLLIHVQGEGNGAPTRTPTDRIWSR